MKFFRRSKRKPAAPRGSETDRSLRVFIPVYYVAPLGGLQEHVRQITRVLQRQGHVPVVMCKPGPFADQLEEAGVDVLLTDYADPAKDLQLATHNGPFDLVHAHPFQSRTVGLRVAEHFSVPFILTLHAMYVDAVDQYDDKLDLLITVCPAIRDLVVSRTDVRHAKIVPLHNGTDLSVFRSSGQRKALWASQKRPARIAYVGRLAEMKQNAFSAIADAWNRQSKGEGPVCQWQIVGDGPLLEDLQQAAKVLGPDHPPVEFTGWLGQDAVADIYRAADACIGPGRSALDSMAAGTPTIAAGNYAYLGIVHGKTRLEAHYGNFGECRETQETYTDGHLTRDLEWLFSSAERWEEVSRQSAAWAAEHFDQDRIDRQLISLYRTVLQG